MSHPVWKILVPSVNWEEQCTWYTTILITREDMFAFWVHCPMPRSMRQDEFPIELLCWSLCPDQSPSCPHVLIHKASIYAPPTTTTATGIPHTSAARFSGKQSFQSEDKHTHQQQMMQNSWNEQREGCRGSNAILKALCPFCTANSCNKSCLTRIIWSELEVWERWLGRGLLRMCVCVHGICVMT